MWRHQTPLTLRVELWAMVQEQMFGEDIPLLIVAAKLR